MHNYEYGQNKKFDAIYDNMNDGLEAVPWPEEIDNMTIKEIKDLIPYLGAERDYILSLYVNVRLTLDELTEKTGNSTLSNSSFTPDELKRLRFCMHPDKNGGKHTDLFRKINDMVESNE